MVRLQTHTRRADKRTMVDTARFDLSRLEGCTGTVSDRGVALPHTMVPARPRGTATPSTRTARPDASPPSTAPKDRDRGRTNPVPGEAIDLGRDEEAAQHRSVPHPSNPVSAAATVKDAVATSCEVPASSPTTAKDATIERDTDSLPVALILALTLSAWIPVLLLWSSRL